MRSYEAIGLCIGRDADLMADVLGRKAITLRRWKQDPLQSGATNPVDSLEKLMQTALDVGRPRSEALAPLAYLERLFSGPRVETNASVHSSFADLQRETSHLTAEYSAAVRDGFISPDEARRMRRQVAHLEDSIEELKLVLGKAA
jgi:hypothetical protein